jgi:polyhydroxyalkanoate synthesis regulator phasin
MEDLFKKFIYTGIGWVSNATDKLKKNIDDFISEGKLSAEDGKKIVDEFLKNAESKKDEVESQFNKLMDELLKSIRFAKLDELKKLEDRVNKLEAQIKKEKKKEPVAKKKVVVAKKKEPVIKKPAKSTKKKK